MPEIQKMSYTHEAIAEFLVSNPMASQGECARFFGYSEAWLSQIIHSDAFQAFYRRLAEERGAIACHTIADKITGLAAVALDKATEKLEMGSASERFLTDTTEIALKALGYLNGSSGPSNDSPQQHMHVHVDAEMLVKAREDAARRFAPPLPPEPATI